MSKKKREKETSTDLEIKVEDIIEEPVEDTSNIRLNKDMDKIEIIWYKQSYGTLVKSGSKYFIKKEGQPDTSPVDLQDKIKQLLPEAYHKHAEVLEVALWGRGLVLEEQKVSVPEYRFKELVVDAAQRLKLDLN